MPLERRKWITRDMMRAEPQTLFVFGDNLSRFGMGGQAKEMRGESNAIGLPTKRSPTKYLTDADISRVQHATRDDINTLKWQLENGGIVVWPSDGIGTGLANLHWHAPSIEKFYAVVLAELEKIEALPKA
jgi:hypothetical protein